MQWPQSPLNTTISNSSNLGSTSNNNANDHNINDSNQNKQITNGLPISSVLNTGNQEQTSSIPSNFVISPQFNDKLKKNEPLKRQKSTVASRLRQKKKQEEISSFIDLEKIAVGDILV